MVEEDADKRSNADLVKSIRDQIEKLESFHVSYFPALEKRPGGKLVRMVRLWKAALAYRLTDIAGASLELLEKNRLVPGNILTRSVLETVASIHVLNKRMLNTKKPEEFWDFVRFLWDAAFGSRDKSSKNEAMNVLTMLDRLDKKFEGRVIRHQYDHLSEYAHPNLKGGLMAYADIDLDTLSSKLGINPGNLPLFNFGLGDLELVLDFALEECEAFSSEVDIFECRVRELPDGVFVD